MEKADPRKFVYVAFGLVVVVMTIVVIRCAGKPEQSEEDFLRGLIDHIVVSAEKRNIKELRQWLSRDYHDGGGRDYRLINMFLLQHFLRKGTLSVYVISKTVDVDRSKNPLQATMKVTAILTRRPKVKQLMDIIPESARALAFDLKFAKEQDEWRLTSANWDNVPNVRSFLTK